MAKHEQPIGSETETRVAPADFIPMSMPQQMLEVPEIPGYHLYWFADRPGRIARAMRGGYEFVAPEEAQLNNAGLASNSQESGSTDLGSRVSVHGGVSEQGQSERLYLMKIRDELWERSQAILAQRNEQTAAALRGGKVGAERDASGDTQRRYVRSETDLFTPKRRP